MAEPSNGMPLDAQSTSSAISISEKKEHITPKNLQKILKTRKELLKKKKKLEEREVDFEDEEAEDAYIRQEGKINESLLKIERKLHRAGLLTDIDADNLEILDKKNRPNIFITGTGHKQVDERISAEMQKKMETNECYELNCFLATDEIAQILRAIRKEELKAKNETSIPKPQTNQFDELIDKIVQQMKKTIVHLRYMNHEKNLDAFLTPEEKKKLDTVHPIAAAVPLQQAIKRIFAEGGGEADKTEGDSGDECENEEQTATSDGEGEAASENGENGSDDEDKASQDGEEEDEELEENETDQAETSTSQVKENCASLDESLQNIVVNGFNKLAEKQEKASSHLPDVAATPQIDSATKDENPCEMSNKSANGTMTEDSSIIVVHEHKTTFSDAGSDIECLGVFYNAGGNEEENNKEMEAPEVIGLDKNEEPEEEVPLPRLNSPVVQISPPIEEHAPEPEGMESPPVHEEHKLKPSWLQGVCSNSLAKCYVRHLEEEDILVVHASENAEYEEYIPIFSQSAYNKTSTWIDSLKERHPDDYEDYSDSEYFKKMEQTDKKAMLRLRGVKRNCSEDTSFIEDAESHSATSEKRHRLEK